MVVVRGRDYQDANGCRRRLRWKIPGPPASPLPPSNICQPLLMLHPSSSYQRAAGSSRECHDDRTEWRRSHHRGQPLPCNWLTMVSASCRPLSRSNFFFLSFCPIRLSPPSFAPLVVKDIIRHILNQNDTFRPALDLLRRSRLAKNDTSGFSLIEISILMFICYLWVAGRRGGMGGIRIECVCRSVVGASCDTQIETEGYHLTPAAES